MKFLNIAVFGALLAASPFALADTIYGSLSLSGTGTISTTGLTFPQGTPNVFAGNTTNTSSNPYFDQANGAVFSSGGDFAIYDASAHAHFVTGATSKTKNLAGTKWTGRNLAKLVFPTTLGVPYSTPVQFIQVIEGGKTLDIYLTELDTVVVGTANTVHNHVITPGKTGSLVGFGFVTDDGDLTHTDGIFTLTDSGVGAGKQAFSATFTSENPMSAAPEPGGVALLGTGFLSVAGAFYRKRFAA